MSVDPITQHLFDNLGTCDCCLCQQLLPLLKNYLPLLRSLPQEPPGHFPETLYHFTIVKIRGDRLLPRQAASCHPKAVWLTASPGGESLVPNAAYRIEVSSTKAVYVSDFIQKIEPANAFGLFMSAILAGSHPWEWYVAYEPLPYRKIINWRF